MDTAWLCHRHGGTIETDFWDLLVRLARHVARIWTEPDEGIWEVRGGRRQFVYSKVMAWVAIDRLIRLGRALGRPTEIERDARSGEFLGNFPQAFSHVGLINSAIQLGRQESLGRS